LLAFSRRQVLKPFVLDVNSIIQEVDKMLRRLIGENIELTTKLGENIGRVKADPSQVEQVIMNLVVNARDAMPDGGRLLIETADAEIGPEYATQHPGVEPGEYVMVAVSDTGHGMDAATQARIFEPFFTTKEVGKGTGLGLSTVYGIVKQSGGHIWVYSEVGHGTTFKIYLPRVNEAAEAAASQVEDDAATSGTETVLVVEDDELVRDLAVSVLRKAGYNVLSACDGTEALDLVSNVDGKIDLVVSDVIMPSMSGGGMVERLLAMNENLRVVFMSGYTSRGLLAQSVLPENIPFIQKPFTASTLLRVVRSALDDAGKSSAGADGARSG
jgi:CheY-like chemotaxis protein